MYEPNAPSDEDTGPSKSQLKREDDELTAVAQQLLRLSRKAVDELPAGPTLLAAIHESRRIRSHEARRRLLRRIVKLIREDDVEALTLAADRLSPDSQLSMALTRRAEHWADRLVHDPSAALTAFVDEHPGVDVQGLRQRQRKALPEAGADAPGPARRELLRFIRRQLAGAAS